ncbi:MAG TPA: TIGR03435 family protein [Bryobacteraceae bacterium]|nr:TIGR03435 family protein [Bryobacteraceae bacterium]
MDLTISGTRVRMEGYSVFSLIMEAYNVKQFQISLASLPSQDREVREVMYDIDARAPGTGVPPRQDVRAMVQTLLVNRFHLAVHRESKEMSVYALVVSKEGERLKKSADEGEPSMHTGIASNGRNYEITFSRCRIDDLTDQLMNLLNGKGEPVVDRTGLTGRYDFSLIATPEFKLRSSSAPGDIDVFSAVQQLGLRLERQKLPIEMIAVDHVTKPTAN